MPQAEARLKPLMVLSLGGDAAAYRSLLAELSRHLRAYYRRRLGAACADTEDLVQEMLIVIHTRRASYDRTQPFTAWVHAMAHYKLVDYLRRKKVREAIPVEDCDELFAPDEIGQAAASRDVERLLAGLPGAVSEAIRLTHIEGHKVEEAAQRLGKSTTATKVSIYRALARLSGKPAGKSHADD